MSTVAWLFALSVLGAPLDLLRFDQSAVGDGVPPEWKVRGVRGQEHDLEALTDYRRIWHEEPPPIVAVGIMQDTDQTGERAVAEIRRLEWKVP